MTIYWPVALPQTPLRSGLSAQEQDGNVSFQPDAGDAKVRLRFTGVLKDISATFRLTPTQRDALTAFWKTTTARGTLPFTWTDPHDGTSGTFRFTSPPQWSSPTANVWQAVCAIRRID
jgi:hypothetical protein